MTQPGNSVATWQARIDAWKESGGSMAKWCREQQINYNQFVYWKDKLDRINHKSQEAISSRFIELVDAPVDPGIALEYAGVQIHLKSNFDKVTLQRCVQVLRETV